MKKSLIVLVLLSLICMMGCSKDNSLNEEEPQTVNLLVTASSLKTEIGQKVTFTVTANGQAIPDATLFVNGQAITGYDYSFAEKGTFTVTAEKGSNKSTPIYIKVEEPAFDINKPVGYIIYTKWASTNSSERSLNNIYLYDFLPEGKIHPYLTYQRIEASAYTITNGNTIEFRFSGYPETYYFTIENGKLTGVRSSIENYYIFNEYSLIKKPAASQVAGKTFKGKYLKKDGTILHQEFFYTFLPDGKTVEAGFKVGTKTRTETYTNIGNIGARVDKVSVTPGDTEIMVLVDGRLHVNYLDKVSSPSKVYHGIFEEVK
ncbi:MAG: hypothetical protein ACTHLE_06000 [Agriterribacter sp.]